MRQAFIGKSLGMPLSAADDIQYHKALESIKDNILLDENAYKGLDSALEDLRSLTRSYELYALKQQNYVVKREALNTIKHLGMESLVDNLNFSIESIGTVIKKIFSTIYNVIKNIFNGFGKMLGWGWGMAKKIRHNESKMNRDVDNAITVLSRSQVHELSLSVKMKQFQFLYNGETKKLEPLQSLNTWIDFLKYLVNDNFIKVSVNPLMEVFEHDINKLISNNRHPVADVKLPKPDFGNMKVENGDDGCKIYQPETLPGGFKPMFYHADQSDFGNLSNDSDIDNYLKALRHVNKSKIEIDKNFAYNESHEMKVDPKVLRDLQEAIGRLQKQYEILLKHVESHNKSIDRFAKLAKKKMSEVMGVEQPQAPRIGHEFSVISTNVAGYNSHILSTVVAYIPNMIHLLYKLTSQISQATSKMST